MNRYVARPPTTAPMIGATQNTQVAGLPNPPTNTAVPVLRAGITRGVW
jgi:hypothetical protein